MKVSVALMKYYSDEQQWRLPVGELVAKIGEQLGAVEETIELGPKYNGIAIVEITEVKKHPNADKLNVYQMFNGKDHVQVVSGDTALRVGDKVAWIAPGQTVPSTFGTDAPVVMEARPLRGEMSNGMFGSGKELGLNDDHHHVAVLDTDAPAGTLLADAYDLNDTIIDIENKMFTHRPDGFGNLGVAREISGIQGLPFVSPDWYAEDITVPQANNPQPILTVTNDIPELVPRYMAVVLGDITIAPSPLWLQSILMRLGIRPINNIVDITNYYMVLTGQPLHAFDFDKVAVDGKAHITVRKPKASETLTLLDGKTITSGKNDMLICNQAGPIALGGVMGGKNTEISNETKCIILEVATFDMYTIRRTSMAHGIFTDAVTRYSKGQSPRQTASVLAKVIAELTQAGAHQISDVTDVYKPQARTPITVTSEFINVRLGSDLSAEAIATMLNNVEIAVETHGDELLVTSPFWRTDLEIPEDIVEEAGRLRGYNALPHTLPHRSTKAVSLPPMDVLKNRLRNVLAAAGANELQNYSFVPAKLLQTVGQNPDLAYAIRNALSPELQHYRLSLTPSLLEKVHPNSKAGYTTLALFELNKIHIKTDMDCDGLPREYQTLAFVFAAQKPQPGAAYYQAKHYLEHILKTLNAPYKIVPAINESPFEIGRQIFAPFEPKRSGYVLIGDADEFGGFIGEYHTAARKGLKLPDYSAGFEIDLERLLQHQRQTTYLPLLKFPATMQDVTLKVNAEVRYADVAELAASGLGADERLRVTVAPLDIYMSDSDASHKHITLRITLQHSERTLTTDDTNDLLDDMVRHIAASIPADRV